MNGYVIPYFVNYGSVGGLACCEKSFFLGEFWGVLSIDFLFCFQTFCHWDSESLDEDEDPDALEFEDEEEEDNLPVFVLAEPSPPPVPPPPSAPPPAAAVDDPVP